MKNSIRVDKRQLARHYARSKNERKTMRLIPIALKLIAITGTIATAILVAVPQSAASTDKTLYSFSGGTDGGSPSAGLIFDSAGNAYGTAFSGGSNGLGVVFELSRASGGTWTETVLYNFGSTSSDGANPGSALVFDASGNLYGTTTSGGLYNHGTVFELKLSSAVWTEAILHNFGSSSTDGTNPIAGVSFDQAGNLYGTAVNGGIHGWGTVYELIPSNGVWKSKTIYAFQPGKYGVNPIAGVAIDAASNLYGTTAAGGTGAYGNVFKLTKLANGWGWSAIYSFKGGNDGGSSYSTPALDAAGNLYGTTDYRGATDFGTVFQLQPVGSGWKFVLIHTFNGKDGEAPGAGVTLDGAGNVYGTTAGGTTNSGTVYKLSLNSGKWTETILYAFQGGNDGGYPTCVPVLDSTGNIYGTAGTGGTGQNGVVFEITP
jgi:uncharacterized repeat protein (TIGR03803 family)